jgi:alpha-D-xyloside xylohydrolase
MHQQDYHVNFWQHAFTSPSSPMYDALKSWAGDYAVWGGLVPDFASREGRQIFLVQNRNVLFDKGVDAVKLDECDYQPESAIPWSFPTASKFPFGLDGEQMHSLFALLYQQTMLKPFQEKSLRTSFLKTNPLMAWFTANIGSICENKPVNDVQGRIFKVNHRNSPQKIGNHTEAD